MLQIQSHYIKVAEGGVSNTQLIVNLDKFWIKSLNGTFIALQFKAFGPTTFKFHAGVKKCHFGNFLEWAGMAVPC